MIENDDVYSGYFVNFTRKGRYGLSVSTNSQREQREAGLKWRLVHCY